MRILRPWPAPSETPRDKLAAGAVSARKRRPRATPWTGTGRIWWETSGICWCPARVGWTCHIHGTNGVYRCLPNPRKVSASVAAILQEIELLEWLGTVGAHQCRVHPAIGGGVISPLRLVAQLCSLGWDGMGRSSHIDQKAEVQWIPETFMLYRQLEPSLSPTLQLSKVPNVAGMQGGGPWTLERYPRVRTFLWIRTLLGFFISCSSR